MAANKQTRKELLNEPDEFLTFSDHAVKWVKENTRAVAIGAGVVVVAVVVLVSILGYMKSQREAASLALAEAFPAYAQAMAAEDAKALAEGLSAMKKVADEYGSFSAGKQARLAVGSLSMLAKKYAEAGKSFKSLTEESGVPKSIKALAWRGLGQSQEAGGDLKAAAASYQSALTEAGPNLADIVKMDRARVLAASGGKAEAEKIYRAMLASRGNAILAAQAKNSLVALGLRP